LQLAERLYREALAIDRKFLDSDDIHRSYCLIGFGKLLTQTNQFEEARGMLESAYEMRKNNLPAEHVLIGISQQALGECLLAMKEYDTAIYLLNEAYNSLNSMPVKYRDNLQSILEQLIFTYGQTGSPEGQLRYEQLLNDLSS
jgi:tetratricopeptide (TPR) repeat protein